MHKRYLARAAQAEVVEECVDGGEQGFVGDAPDINALPLVDSTQYLRRCRVHAALCTVCSQSHLAQLCPCAWVGYQDAAQGLACLLAACQ